MSLCASLNSVDSMYDASPMISTFLTTAKYRNLSAYSSSKEYPSVNESI